jgi:hypothetical protein
MILRHGSRCIWQLVKCSFSANGQAFLSRRKMCVCQQWRSEWWIVSFRRLRALGRTNAVKRHLCPVPPNVADSDRTVVRFHSESPNNPNNKPCLAVDSWLFLTLNASFHGLIFALKPHSGDENKTDNLYSRSVHQFLAAPFGDCEGHTLRAIQRNRVQLSNTFAVTSSC